MVVSPCVAADPLAEPVAVSGGDAWSWGQFLPAGQFRDGAGPSRLPDPDQAVGEPVEVAGLAEVPRSMHGAADGSAERSRTVPREAGLSSAAPTKNVPRSPSPNGPPTMYCRSGGPSPAASVLCVVAIT